MDKRFIQRAGAIGRHKALPIGEVIEAPLAEHIKVIAVSNDFIDIVR